MKCFKIIFLIALLILNLYSEDSCTSPTDNIILDQVLDNQEIDKPFIIGDSSSGEALFYKIVLSVNGQLIINSATDNQNSDNKVNTYGELLDSSCNSLENGVSISSDPRYFKVDKVLNAGTYYLRVYNEISLDDSDSSFLEGFFQIENSFTASLVPKNIDLWRSDPDIIESGSEVIDTIYIKNRGSEATTSVKITMPSESSGNFSFINIVDSTGWSCNSNEPIVCTLDGGVLGSGEQRTIRVRYRANYRNQNRDVTNLTDADIGYSDDSTLVKNSSRTLTIKKALAGIKIDKDAPDSVYENKEFSYTISVENNGTLVDSNVTVTDKISADFDIIDLSYDPAAWHNCDYVGKDISCELIDDLAVGESKFFYIKVKAVGDPDNPEDVIYSAFANSDTAMGHVVDDDSKDVKILASSPSINISKSAPSSVVSKDSFYYTIVVSNDGSEDETFVEVSDLIDDRFVLPSDWSDAVETPWGCSKVGQDITCVYDSTLRSDTTSSTIKIKVEAPLVVSDTLINNSAIVDAKANDVVNVHDESSVGVTISPIASNIGIVKSSSEDIILENDIFNYTITINNSTILDEQNISVEDDIPNDFTIVSYSASGWNCTNSSNLVTCTMATLGANSQADDINITVKAPSKIAVDKVVTNSAKVTSSKDSDGTIAQKSVTLVAPTKALSIHKSSEPSSVYVGDLFHYKIFISNNSGRDIDSVTISDILPVELKYDHYESGGWNCAYDSASREFSCDNNGTKFHAGDKEIYLYVKAPSYECEVTNSASISSSLDSYDRESNATTLVRGKSANLIFTKRVSNKDIALVDENITYSIRVKNDGSSPNSDINATNVKVIFTVDSDMKFEGINTLDWNCTIDKNITCILPLLELGLESSDINITLSSPIAKETINNLSLSADQLSSAVESTISVDVKDLIVADLSIDISDDIDPVDGGSNYQYLVQVVNPHLSKDLDGIKVEIDTLSATDYDLVGYMDTDDWSCSKSGTLLECFMSHSLPADSSINLKIEVNAPNITSFIEVNSSLSSKFVNDTNMLNNSDIEKTNIVVYDLSGNNTRDFTKVPIQGNEDTNIYGDMISIGNQSICEKNSEGNCQEPSYFVNDLIYQEYIKLDTLYGSDYMNSTKALLSINPEDEIIWAGLYWMGRIDKTQSGYEQKMKDANKIYIRHDSDTSGYKSLFAQRDATSIDNNGSTIKVDKFNFINSSDYFDYQGMADVTSYVKVNRSGDYWIAGVQSSEGENLSAGWNMVVIVKDTKDIPTRDLKNITIFDGFLGVWKSPPEIIEDYPDEVNQSVNGFLTPAFGEISSKMIFFGFEGDKTLKDYIKISDKSGVMHSLVNAQNEVDDMANGTISENGIIVSDRSPSLENTSGIDIDIFNIGDSGANIIENSQSSTNIMIGSDGDRFFLGMFGFSTSLRDPICYVQTYKNGDFTSDIGSEVYLGDEVGVEVEFRNIEIQTLENFQAVAYVDSSLKEDNSSFELKNIDESGLLEGDYSSHNELFDFGYIDLGDQNQSEIIVRSGSGADSSSGGLLKKDQSIFFRYRAVVEEIYDINDTNQTRYMYKAIYAPSDKKIMVSSCGHDMDFPTVKKNSTNGFEITHEGGLVDGINDGLINEDITKPSNENHLFTQIVDKNFSIDVVALSVDTLNKDKVRESSNPYKGLLKLELIDKSGSSSDCSLYSLLQKEYIGMYGVKSTEIISYHDAKREVGFRVSYLVDKYGKYFTWNSTANTLVNLQDAYNKLDKNKICKVGCESPIDENICRECLFKRVEDGGFSRVSCSSDTFSIRPKEIKIDINSTNLIGAKDYRLDLNSSVVGYDQNITPSNGSLDYQLIVPVGCSLGSDSGNLLTSTINFIDGEANITNFKYDNIGDIKVSFIDKGWSLLDQNSSNSMMSDCIIGSGSNIEIGGKVGCNIKGEELFSFKPDRFENIVTLNDFSSSGFVYLSNDKNMSALLKLKIEAFLFDGTVASNYTHGCFANSVTYKFDLINSDPLDWSGSNAQNEINFYEDGNSSIDVGVAHDGEFRTDSQFFNLGVAQDLKIFLNFNRDTAKAMNPFTLKKSDFNITSMSDTNSTLGKDFDRSGSDESVVFYYGRLHVSDIETSESNCNAPIYYEIYCKDCNKSRYTFASGAESIDSIYWYINNISHSTQLQGSYQDTVSSNGVVISDESLNGMKLSLGGLKAPHRDKIRLKPSSWLVHDKFNSLQEYTMFGVSFTSVGINWGGQGELGLTVDTDISPKHIERMDW